MARPVTCNLQLWTLVGLLVACTSTSTPTPALPPVSLTLSGATATVPLLTLLAARFEMQNPSVRVIVEAGNSHVSLEQVTSGTALLGALSIAPPAELWAAPIAVSGIAIAVHPDNPLEGLTLAQAHDVFGGRIWQWSELGIAVEEDEIVVVSREEGSGTRMAFEAVAMASDRATEMDCRPALTIRPEGGAIGTRLCEGDPVTSMAVLIPEGAAVADFVAVHPGAIGYLSWGHVGSQVKAVRVEGLAPTPEHVADGSYPLSQPFFLVALDEPTGTARQFVDFCLSAEGQAIVAERYVPVRER